MISSLEHSVVKVIDDDEAVCDSICALLESFDIPALPFTSARRALVEIVWHTAGCLVVDHHMPEMTGLEFLKTIRERQILTPLILMSAAADPTLDQRARIAGAMAVLSKPIGDGELLDLVRRAMTASHATP
ncbi:MAG: response regulator [Rhodospirillaceae bacterium]|nr:response regulator [Rhodospirillaceae bacterium]